jgi:hypothetical protein
MGNFSMLRICSFGVLLCVAASTSGCWLIPPVTFYQGKRLPVVPISTDLLRTDYEPLAGLLPVADDVLVTGLYEVVAVDTSGAEIWSYDHGERYAPSRVSDLERGDAALYASGIFTRSPYFTVRPEQYVLKLSPTGREIWRRAYPIPQLPANRDDYFEDEPVFHEVVAMPDGGFATAGGGVTVSDSFPLLVMRGDAEGEVAWTYEGAGSQRAIIPFDAKAWRDGGVLLVGARNTREGDAEVVLLSISPAGAFEWEKTVTGLAEYVYSSSYLSQFSDLVPLEVDVFAVATAQGSRDSTASIVEINRAGNLTVHRDAVRVSMGLGSYGASVLGLEFDDDQFTLGLVWKDDYPHLRVYELSRNAEVRGMQLYSRVPGPDLMAMLPNETRAFLGTARRTSPVGGWESFPFLMVDADPAY